MKTSDGSALVPPPEMGTPLGVVVGFAKRLNDVEVLEEDESVLVLVEGVEVGNVDGNPSD
ncbi:hypothetical protein DACRYDRAFT_25229 [Dacryopinax primogenitus]|uniref:Uncharacterized protein n=1 Tax=Dacryopinax primogenitus (strain DJM 731) TaxID=1858805 RepID=M5FNA4_DACPD|nr:uncharacterized protein DACRYDRAFT_25229 [Dacryopinax primogenitus]EJT97100.1 hypothetical protein DACRYDRAFT_25229 [Dacryopinax primogenitus]